MFRHSQSTSEIDGALPQQRVVSPKLTLQKAIDGINMLYCWVLALIFIYAGAIKLLSPSHLYILIEAFGILPEILITPVAVLLPALEILAGIGLLLNIRGSLPAIAALLMIFAAVMAYGVYMGLDVDCGCFGPQDPEAEAFHGIRTSLMRDLAMLAGLAFVFAWRRYRRIRSIERSLFF